MAITSDVNTAIVVAMKAHDQIRLATLRLLKTALVNKAVERGHELDDPEALHVITSLVKQRRESIEQFVRGGRQDLADREAAEIRILEAYLPPAVEPAEIERIVDQVIAEAGATSARDVGRVMKLVMGRLAGQAVDGKAVNELARRKLGGGA